MAIITEKRYEAVRRRVMRKQLIRKLDDALANGSINSYTVEALIDRLDKLMSVQQPTAILAPSSKLLH